MSYRCRCDGRWLLDGVVAPQKRRRAVELVFGKSLDQRFLDGTAGRTTFWLPV